MEPSVMPVDPKDAFDAAGAAKGSWQWIIGGIMTGAYTVWKYLHHRMAKMEDRISAVVTTEQLREHTQAEDNKFALLFEKHDKLSEQLAEGIRHLEVIADKVGDTKTRQGVNEEKLARSERDIAAIQERHRLEERRSIEPGRRDYDSEPHGSL